MQDARVQAALDSGSAVEKHRRPRAFPSLMPQAQRICSGGDGVRVRGGGWGGLAQVLVDGRDHVLLGGAAQNVAQHEAPADLGQGAPVAPHLVQPFLLPHLRPAALPPSPLHLLQGARSGPVRRLRALAAATRQLPHTMRAPRLMQRQSNRKIFMYIL